MDIRTYSRKTDKLRNVYILGSRARNISIKEWKLTFFKIKSSRLSYILDETMPFVMDKSTSKKGDSISKKFALFVFQNVTYCNFQVAPLKADIQSLAAHQ